MNKQESFIEYASRVIGEFVDKLREEFKKQRLLEEELLIDDK